MLREFGVHSFNLWLLDQMFPDSPDQWRQQSVPYTERTKRRRSKRYDKK